MTATFETFYIAIMIGKGIAKRLQNILILMPQKQKNALSLFQVDAAFCKQTTLLTTLIFTTR